LFLSQAQAKQSTCFIGLARAHPPEALAGMVGNMNKTKFAKKQMTAQTFYNTVFQFAAVADRGVRGGRDRRGQRLRGRLAPRDKGNIAGDVIEDIFFLMEVFFFLFFRPHDGGGGACMAAVTRSKWRAGRHVSMMRENAVRSQLSPTSWKKNLVRRESPGERKGEGKGEGRETRGKAPRTPHHPGVGS